MVERERGKGRQDDDRHGVEAVVHPVGQGAADQAESQKAGDDECHRRVMASAERVMRKHRGVFAALAK